MRLPGFGGLKRLEDLAPPLQPLRGQGHRGGASEPFLQPIPGRSQGGANLLAGDGEGVLGHQQTA